eukprot:11655092-Alexandrium_andersonii.AAC.1
MAGARPQPAPCLRASLLAGGGGAVLAAPAASLLGWPLPLVLGGVVGLTPALLPLLPGEPHALEDLSLIHISEPTRLALI